MKKIALLTIVLLSAFTLFAQNGLSTGTMAPNFTAKDYTGKTVDLKQVLQSHKAVVLFFYRGQWCPYCNKQISHLQDSLQLLMAKGVYVIGITPETDENIQKTVAKTKASFSMVHDNDYQIMRAYDVKYVLNDDMLGKYKAYGIDLEQNNGNTDHVLPVPATYVIDHTGKIIFAHFDKDYRQRPSIASLLTIIPR